jgi:hypothetical protein
LPILLALVAYYGPVLRGGSLKELCGDASFYVYQYARAGEVGGRWWAMGDDHRVGWPYQAEIAKHPGLYEGVDLMLAAALFGRLLGPAYTYHALILLTLAVNGWIAAWIVHRLTRSYLWAALAISLLTLNFQVGRISGHPHLIKFGWVVLAVYAFSGYLHRPTTRRGLLLGLAAAWVLQGSFYLGYLLAIGLGAWWIGCLLGGRLDRRHLAATAAAGLTFALAAAALTFPVWTIARRNLFSDDYFQRLRVETWFYSAGLWQYFVPPWSLRPYTYINELNHKPSTVFWEAWNFPGYTVLLALGLYAVACLRGRRPCAVDPRPLALAVGLIPVFVVLSLSDGPCFYLYDLFPAVRCYGRAGLVALALGCVAAPVILHDLIGSLRQRWARAPLVAAVLALAAADGHWGVSRFGWAVPKSSRPEWVDWLAAQPAGVRLAAFAPAPVGPPIEWWGLKNLEYFNHHRHATLNGCEFRLLQGDLKLLGCSYDRLNPAGLRLVASLGYRTLAFHDAYLDANPWLRSCPWLEPLDRRGPWAIYHTGDSLPCFPRRKLEQVLADRPLPTEAEVVPARAWITGQLGVDQDVVITGGARVLAAWEDAAGHRVGRPAPALYQHVIGPGLPAYTVRTPSQPGTYRLVFRGAGGRGLAERTYRVAAEVPTSRRAFGVRPPPLSASIAGAELAPFGGAALRLTLANRSGYYIQTHVGREAVAASARAQPGVAEPAAGSFVLRAHMTEPPGGGRFREFDLLLPRDLPPGGQLELELPADRLDWGGPRARVDVLPVFYGIGQPYAPAPVADLRLEVAGLRQARLAGPSASEVADVRAQRR